MVRNLFENGLLLSLAIGFIHTCRIWFTLEIEYNDIMRNIDWTLLSPNPPLFVLDYQALCKERTEIIRKELIEKTWHPSRFVHWCLDTCEKYELEIN